MKLLPLLCLLPSLVGFSSAQEIRDVNKQEGEDALLPCTLNFSKKVAFDWRKDNGKDSYKEVFEYKSGSYPGDDQDAKFKNRVNFFQHELYQLGNASIIIKNISLEDNGTYTCGLQELNGQKIKIRLNLVDVLLKSRLNTFGAAVPHIYTNKDEGTWRLLECRVKGVPNPKVEWRNSADKELAKHIPESEYGQAYVELPLLVNMSDNYTCVATQQKIHHQNNSTLPVRLQENSNSWIVIVAVLAITVVVAACAIVCLIVKLCKIKRKNNGENYSHRSVDEKLVNMTNMTEST